MELNILATQTGQYKEGNLTQNILKIAKTHQSSLIQLNNKLKFYSLFKQDNKKSHYLDLINKHKSST